MVTNFHLRNVQSTIRILQGKLSKLTNPTKPGNFQNYENRFNRTRQVCDWKDVVSCDVIVKNDACTCMSGNNVSEV